MNPPDESKSRHAQLFRSSRGNAVRAMARAGIFIGVCALGMLADALLRRFPQDGPVNAWPFVVAPLIAAIGAVFIHSACAFSRQFVTSLEVWPQSNLVLVRTAGIWRESVKLQPVNAFISANRSITVARNALPIRIQLRSSLRLIFDQHGGEAPQGWPAFCRFLEEGAWFETAPDGGFASAEPKLESLHHQPAQA